MQVGGGRFRLQRQLGKGGFGEVYEGVVAGTNQLVAVKLERKRNVSYLHQEACIMSTLNSYVQITVGFPELIYYGVEGDYSVLVMTILGPSLEDLLEQFDHFSSKTTMMLALQMVQRIEYFHTVGLIHRDLKPDNFLMGVGKRSHHVYLVDYGLSTKWKGSNGHRPLSTGRSLVGTCRYASLRTHQGYSQSRRDDIEQLAYCLVFMRRGRLPWTGLKTNSQKEKEMKVMDMKENLGAAGICRKCPGQFEDLLNYARKMDHEEQPRYEMVTMLFQSVLDDMGKTVDYRYDWVPKKEEEGDKEEQLALSITSDDGGLDGVLSTAEAQALSTNGVNYAPLSPVSSPIPLEFNLPPGAQVALPGGGAEAEPPAEKQAEKQAQPAN